MLLGGIHKSHVGCLNEDESKTTEVLREVDLNWKNESIQGFCYNVHFSPVVKKKKFVM